MTWRLTIKQPQTNQQLIHHSLKICIGLDKTEIDLSKVTSKLLNNKFKTKRQTPPSVQNKMKNQYPQLMVDCKKNLFLRCTVTAETKIGAF